MLSEYSSYGGYFQTIEQLFKSLGITASVYYAEDDEPELTTVIQIELPAGEMIEARGDSLDKALIDALAYFYGEWTADEPR